MTDKRTGGPIHCGLHVALSSDLQTQDGVHNNHGLLGVTTRASPTFLADSPWMP